MMKVESNNGIVKVEMSTNIHTAVSDMADIILTVNERFNNDPYPVKNHFWVAVSEMVNEILMEESKR